MIKRRLREFWFQIHKWIGLALALVLIPLSVTGSLLVWDEPLDRLLRPAHYAPGGRAALPASRYLDAARRGLPPGSAIVSLAIGEGPVVVTALVPQPDAQRGPPRRLAAWIDPASGTLIDSGPPASPLLRWAHDFHGHLLLPGAGRALVGWLGAAMLVSSLTGIWLWWPHGGRWSRGLRWRRQPALDANLHHLVGFWVSLPLAMLSLTGAIIAWPQMTGSAPPRRAPPPPLARPALTVDRVLAAAGSGARVKVTWPTATDPAWTVSVPPAAAAKVDDATGRVEAAAGGSRTRPLYRRLHDGTGMGLVWQVVIFLGGLAPAVLGVTGLLMWLRMRRRHNDVSRRAKTSVAAM